MFKKALLALALLAATTSAYSQPRGNPTCPTRAYGDDSNACASTGFVQDAVQGVGGQGGLDNIRLAITGNYTVLAADVYKTIALGGNDSYTLTFAAASTYIAAFQVRVVNEDATEPKTLAINGLDDITLNAGQTITVYAQNNVWKTDWNQIGPIYFKSGSPWADVRAFGAKGDQTTDDTAAFQAAIDAIQNGPGAGIVFIPAGNYCLNSGVTVTSNYVRIVGGSQPFIQTCNNDATIITLNGYGSSIENLNVSGYRLGATVPAIIMGSDCVECVIKYSIINGGTNALLTQAGDVLVIDTNMGYAFGSAIVKTERGAAYFIRDKVDQGWPTGAPNSGTSISAWTNGNVYSVGDVVSTQGYYIQCTVGGTSGGSPPTLQNYQTSITDNTVTWRLVAPTTYYALQIDTDSSVIYVYGSDFTGPYTAGLAMTDTGSGSAPESIFVTDSTFGQMLTAGILLSAGNAATLKGNQITGCIFTGCAGIALTDAWMGDAVIIGSQIFQVDYGIHIAAGINATITANQIYDALTAGIKVDADITDFIITGNLLGASPVWGGNAIAVQVATGASDYYNITNNAVHGSAIGVDDGGSGINKTVTGNN